MSEPFVGEVRMFAGNFAPRGWAFCDGQLLAVSQNDALFSLLGTIYGGDGHTTFGLPDMRGRIPIHPGTGPGLSPRRLGSKGGAEHNTLTTAQLPSHTHALQGSADPADSSEAAGKVLADTNFVLYATEAPNASLAGQSMTDNAGGGRAINNVMPSLCVHFIIALVGIYPSRH